VNFFYDDIFNHFFAMCRGSYRIQWNNAKYGPLRRSRSFKVIDFGTSRKLIYDLLFVIITTNLPPILHRFQDIAFDRSKIAIFGYPSCVQLLRRKGSLHHVIVSYMSLKLDNLGYISVAESLSISSTAFTQCAPEATEFDEITQSKGH